MSASIASGLDLFEGRRASSHLLRAFVNYPCDRALLLEPTLATGARRVYWTLVQ